MDIKVAKYDPRRVRVRLDFAVEYEGAGLPGNGRDWMDAIEHGIRAYVGGITAIHPGARISVNLDKRRP